MRGHSCLTTSKEPSPLRRQGSSDFALGCRVVAIWLACGGLSTSCRRPSHFSLLAQRKVTQRKGPPDESPIGLKPDRYAVGFRAFRRGSCPGEKWLASVPATPAGPSLHPPAASYGARKIKSTKPTARAAAHRIAVGRVVPTLVRKLQAEEKSHALRWRVIHSGREAQRQLYLAPPSKSVANRASSLFRIGAMCSDAARAVCFCFRF
ncbi:hypothetical protein DYST_02055 [Dyella terrae]|nr:hypothetical protein DYST_02055 [Dyella terrae]